MAAIANWYNNQYSTWNRMRRMHATPFLARAETNASRTATAVHRNTDAPLNMSDLLHESDAAPNRDTLFGPSLGPVNTGPDWANTNDEKSPGADELTPDIVKGWVAKSKEASEPTTTLQALVNLKRPTIRLSPLAAPDADAEDQDDPASRHLHGLEFEFDCDAPKCRVSMHVVVPGAERLSVFEALVPGGFGRKLKLEEGATLDLGKFEHVAAAPPPTAPLPAEEAAAASTTSPTAAPPAPAPATDAVQNKKRLTFFRRRQEHARPVAGPALAVVDAEAAPTAGTGGENDAKEKADTLEGVKFTIRLASLGEEGEALSAPNEQVTYLHIVRLGAKPAVLAEGEAAEDTRPWVVKVVKREAIIGPHTFQLHEIYGLSSHSSAPSHPTAPTAPTPDLAHAYPPSTPTAAAPLSPVADAAHEEDPTSECLLCLSSPREVVLLPCRHLVACRECAVNMVEFGAGGTLVHTESEPVGAAAVVGPGTQAEVVPTAVAAGAGAMVEGAGAGADPGAEPGAEPASVPAPAPAPVTPVLPPTNTRRKRKAKGWFCPVCRQPYTSLLRITTAPPPAKEKNADDVDGKRSSSLEGDEDPLGAAAGLPVPVTTGAGNVAAPTTRPGFLRHFSRSPAIPASPPANTGTTTPAQTLPPDLERQA